MSHLRVFNEILRHSKIQWPEEGYSLLTQITPQYAFVMMPVNSSRPIIISDTDPNELLCKGMVLREVGINGGDPSSDTLYLTKAKD